MRANAGGEAEDRPALRSTRTPRATGEDGVRRQLGDERWATIVASLEQIRAGGGPLSQAVADVAARLEVAPSTVWARLRRGRQGQERQSRPRYQISDDDRADFYAANGNAAELARRRGPAAGPSVRTMQRAVARDLRAIERVDAKHGWREARKLLFSVSRATTKTTVRPAPSSDAGTTTAPAR